VSEPVYHPARGKARKRALDVLYEADMRGLPPMHVLASARTRLQPPVPEYYAYTESLVRGVVEHAARVDELISSYAEGWTLDRMPPVDRNICRIAVYELLWVDEVDDAVAISEAVELAATLSTDDSPRYLNGLLGRIAEYATR